MPIYTPNLGLLKKDPVTEGSDNFNIDTMLNDNWDKIDAGVGALEEAQSVVDTLVRPNLLDNAYFVGGGSQQGGGQFPINQRGETSYDAGRYSIDRWYNRQDTKASLVSNGLKIEITGTSGYPFYTQRLENYQQYLGKTVTISVMLSEVSANFKGIRLGVDASNSVGTNSYTWPTVGTYFTQPGVFSVTVKLPDTINYSGMNMSFYLGPSGRAVGDYCVIAAAKLEFGDTQTLAHQENGEWVLNEIPNYQQELAKCQRYAIELNSFGEAYTSLGNGHAGDSSFAYITVPLPVTMRTKPTATLSGSWILEYGAGRNIATGISYIRFMTNGVALKVTSSGLSSGRCYSLESDNDASARLFLSADL